MRISRPILQCYDEANVGCHGNLFLLMDCSNRIANNASFLLKTFIREEINFSLTFEVARKQSIQLF